MEYTYELVKGMYDYICEKATTEPDNGHIETLTIPRKDASNDFMALQFQEYETVLKDKYKIFPMKTKRYCCGRGLGLLWTIIGWLVSIVIVLALTAQNIRNFGTDALGLWVCGLMVGVVLFVCALFCGIAVKSGK